MPDTTRQREYVIARLRDRHNLARRAAAAMYDDYAAQGDLSPYEVEVRFAVLATNFEGLAKVAGRAVITVVRQVNAATQTLGRAVADARRQTRDDFEETA